MCGFIAVCLLGHSRSVSQTHDAAFAQTNGRAKAYHAEQFGLNGARNDGEDKAYALNIEEGSSLTKANAKRRYVEQQLLDAVNKIQHRGPDGSGIWVSADASVGLGQCRLAINDLTSSGSQPLHSDDGLIHAVVNGEIYDFDRLAEECIQKHGYKFMSRSDSELVIALYRVHGSPKFLEHLRGEFAFIIYDERSNRVIAGRDRFGIKPLLWTKVDDRILFASEAKAFLPMGWEPEWDVHSISDSGWMLDDRTLFKGVHKLLPGHWMDVSTQSIEIHKYWDAEYPDKARPDSRSIDEMILGVRERLVESIRLRLRADVPIGVYLSGGIDSSTVAGIITDLIRKENVKLGNEKATRVACFSVRFPEQSGYDESSIADRTAKWLGVESYKREVDEARLASDFATAAYHSEHHHFDLNTVAKFALSSLPREHGIKVVLTGEGSDEHFAGYHWFLPEFLRAPDLGLPGSILANNDGLRESMQKSASDEMGKVWQSQGATEYEGDSGLDIHAYCNGNTMPDNLLAWHPANSLFQQWVQDQYTEMWDMRRTVMNAHQPDVREKMRNLWHPLHTAMYMWNKSTLPNVLLACLGDRVEMAHGIEARTPFLDHHLAEYINSLPPSTKLNFQPPEEYGTDQVNNFWWKEAGSALRTVSEKWILREAARPYITDELYNRRKLPFLAPVRYPEDGPLHNMFKELLTRKAVEGLGFVRFDVIEAALKAAFGDNSDSASFRTLCYVGGWVAISQGFGMKPANVDNSTWADKASSLSIPSALVRVVES
ncbi:Amidase chyE [Paramyrothecium foliicola]|nr:Amidase chyE [Paramyrothecium foliicola]